MITRKTPAQIAKMRKAGPGGGRDAWRVARDAARPGVTTLELDALAREVLSRGVAPGRTS